MRLETATDTISNFNSSNPSQKVAEASPNPYKEILQDALNANAILREKYLAERQADQQATCFTIASRVLKWAMSEGEDIQVAPEIIPTEEQIDEAAAALTIKYSFDPDKVGYDIQIDRKLLAKSALRIGLSKAQISQLKIFVDDKEDGPEAEKSITKSEVEFHPLSILKDIQGFRNFALNRWSKYLNSDLLKSDTEASAFMSAVLLHELGHEAEHASNGRQLFTRINDNFKFLAAFTLISSLLLAVGGGILKNRAEKEISHLEGIRNTTPEAEFNHRFRLTKVTLSLILPSALITTFLFLNKNAWKNRFFFYDNVTYPLGISKTEKLADIRMAKEMTSNPEALKIINITPRNASASTPS
ncbi:MAG: hypothetical protein Fur003_3250 [Candidatus Dojkabacteria bacterium]